MDSSSEEEKSLLPSRDHSTLAQLTNLGGPLRSEWRATVNHTRG